MCVFLLSVVLLLYHILVGIDILSIVLYRIRGYNQNRWWSVCPEVGGEGKMFHRMT